MTAELTSKLQNLKVSDLAINNYSACNQQPVATSVQGELEKALDALSKTVFGGLNQVFHYLHQRSAPRESIKEMHAVKLGEVKALSTQMEKVCAASRTICDCIPSMANSGEQTKALSHMMGIELFAQHLTKQIADLCFLLKDPDRNAALELYKATVRDCEALAKLATADEKLTKLGELVKKFHQSIDPNASPAVSEVHDTTLLFIRYAAYCFKNELAKEDTQLHTRATLVDGYAKQLMKTPGIDTFAQNDAQVPAQNSTVTQYVAQSSKIVVPTENTFRNGGWMRWIASLPGFRYAPIKTQTTTLEGIAQALYRMQTSLHERMKNVCSQNLQELDHDLELCQGLEQLLVEQLVSLAQVKLAEEIHAGWHYVSALHTQAKVVGASITLFKHAACETYKSEIAFVNKIVAVVQSPNRLSELWKLARDLPTLAEECSDTTRVIKQSFAKLVSDEVALKEQERAITNLVFNKTFKWGDEHTESVKNYLVKGFVRYLHVPVDGQKQVDPNFEAVFFMLKCELVYKQGFADWLAASAEVKEMHDTYMKTSDMAANVRLMIAMSNVASTLFATSLPEGVDMHTGIKARYQKASAAINGFAGQESTPAVKLRLDWLGKMRDVFAKAFKEFLEN